jgi:hypothetical protein
MHHGEDRDFEAEQLLVQEAAIALDVAGLFQGTDPAQAGRRGNADPAGELYIGDAAVGLQLGKDMPVDGVETAGQDGAPQRPRGHRDRYFLVHKSAGPACATIGFIHIAKFIFTKQYCAKSSQGVGSLGCVSCMAREMD